MNRTYFKPGCNLMQVWVVMLVYCLELIIPCLPISISIGVSEAYAVNFQCMNADNSSSVPLSSCLRLNTAGVCGNAVQSCNLSSLPLPTCSGTDALPSGLCVTSNNTYYYPGCTSGYYNTADVKCEACPMGATFDSSNNVCYTAALDTNGDCLSGYLFNPTTSRCEVKSGVSYSCPAGNQYQCDPGTWTCNPCQSAICPNNLNNNCTLAPLPVPSCPGGVSLNTADAKCESASSCPVGGTVNVSDGQCETPATVTQVPNYSCPTGFTLTGTSCFSGTVTQPATVTYTNQYSCSSGYSGGSATSPCSATPTCAGGYNLSSTNAAVCQATPTCSSGYFSPSTSACAMCPDGVPYDSADNVCVTGPGNGGCSAGTYDPQKNQCEIPPGVYYTCPVSGGVCGNNNGTWQCSSNACADTSNQAPPTQNAPTGYTNDGQTDAQGNCLGQLYIFSGMATGCQEPGAEDGYHNCCNDTKANAITDSLGTIGEIYMGASKLYGAVMAAYNAVTTYNLISSGQAAFATDVNAIQNVGSTSMTTLSNTTFTISTDSTYAIGGEEGGSLATTTSFTQVSGTSLQALGVTTDPITGAITTNVASATDAALAGAQQYLVAMVSNPLFWAGIVATLVMDFLMQGCTPNDIATSLLIKSSMCTPSLGEYCTDSWPVVGCVQKSQGYCCFNSELALLIQEQGRPQLSDFNTLPNNGWGTAPNQNCRGFTPAEFQALDFTKIDLSSYFATIISPTVNANISNVQSTINSTINNFYQDLK